MARFWGRLGVALGLLAAIFSDLRRRAWWAYRARGVDNDWPRTTIVARRPVERQSYVPVVTPMWAAVAARALPVFDAAVMQRDEDDALPVVFVNTAARPDIADLPRVLRDSPASDGPPVMATQWLVDEAAGRALLVVTYVEPVACTWALSFDVPGRRGVLEAIAVAGELFVAWDARSTPQEEDGAPERLIPTVPRRGLLLSISRPTQIHAILALWAERLSVE